MMFGLPIEFLQAIKKLPANEQGAVHAALWEYAEMGEEPAELSPMADVIFVLAKCWIDRERQMKAEARENGKRGGRPKKAVVKDENPGFEYENPSFEDECGENEEPPFYGSHEEKTPLSELKTPLSELKTPLSYEKTGVLEQEKENEKENKKERSKERNKEKDKEKEYKGQGQEINSLFVSYAPAREEQPPEEPEPKDPGGLDYHDLDLTENNKRVLADLLGEKCAQMALDTAARDKPTAIAAGRYRDDYHLVLDSIPREGAAKYA